jgi:hypothetical protein
MNKQIWLFISGMLCILPSLHPEAMPPISIGDAFKGKSQDEIIKEVQNGQNFLYELQTKGTPEERALFDQLLQETLNSMSAQDLEDLQAIAAMVEPYLEIPEVPAATEQAPPVVEPTSTPTIAPQATEIEKFQNMIALIVQRIDDIIQKFMSSKECTEEFTVRWKLATTLQNMKRLIAQLKTTRLAQKFVDPQITDDNKLLLSKLEAFLKDLTKYNDNLVIEDNFGEQNSRATEQALLKKTQAILTMFEEYIDTLMPLLEKFLSKWDPEALKIAQELADKSSSAAKSSQSATTRQAAPESYSPRSSTNAAPNQYSNYDNYGTGYDYGNYDYPSYDQGQYNYDLAQPQQNNNAPSVTPSTSSAPTVKSAAPTSPAQQEVKKPTSSPLDTIEDHFDQYGPDYTTKLDDFYKKISSGYDSIADSIRKNLPPTEAQTWFDNTFTPYAVNIKQELKNTFHKEFDDAASVVDDLIKSVKDMDAPTAQKVASSSLLTSLSQRFQNYLTKYQALRHGLDAKFKSNIDLIDSQDVKNAYAAQHQALLTSLNAVLENQAAEITGQVELLQRKARRQANRKAT